VTSAVAHLARELVDAKSAAGLDDPVPRALDCTFAHVRATGAAEQDIVEDGEAD
jgi:hypothetical protein